LALPIAISEFLNDVKFPAHARPYPLCHKGNK
jgi:hypothetical protein